MATILELRNDAVEALERAKAIAADPQQSEASYAEAWKVVESTQAAYERAKKLEAAEAALGDDRPKVEDLRNPDDAERVPNVPASVANRAPDNFKQLADGRIVPFATKRSEGYVKAFPASVQLPEVMARYGPELAVEAALEREAFNTYFRFGARARAFNDEKLRNALNRLSARNALQEDEDAEGGFLVPADERSSEIVHDPGAPGGVTRSISRVLTTSRDGGTIPSGTGVTWAPIAEEAAPADSDPVFAQIPFTTRKSGFNDTVSEELLADAAFNVPGYLAMVGNESRGRYEDEQAIGGDGSTEPLGVRTTGAPQGNVADQNVATTLTLTNLTDLYFSLPAQFRGAGAAVHTTSSFWAKAVALAATGGQTWLTPTASSGPVMSLLGTPVVMFDGTGWDDAATLTSTEEVGAIGNYGRYYVFMDRLGMVFRRDDSVGFRSDQVAFKGRARYDSFFTENNAFRIIKVS